MCYHCTTVAPIRVEVITNVKRQTNGHALKHNLLCGSNYLNSPHDRSETMQTIALKCRCDANTNLAIDFPLQPPLTGIPYFSTLFPFICPGKYTWHTESLYPTLSKKMPFPGNVKTSDRWHFIICRSISTLYCFNLLTWSLCLPLI